MELPRALMPWSAHLDLFPRELADALGAIVRRLDAAVGPLRAAARPGSGDPDGFDGLTRRGHYERLLLSEWLLAEEIPEEFARRAAVAEHAFLHLARREPKGGLSAAALFDAGPDQIGAPRIAQIAALIVLARRAEAGGAQFQWGVLQRPVESLQTDVTASALSQLLLARSAKEVCDEDVARWREALKSPEGAEDLWLIGGPRLARLPAASGAAHLHLADPLDPDRREIRAVIRDGNRVCPDIALPLPAEADCARLIRDPFRIAVAKPRRVPGDSGDITAIAFSSDGSKLMARRGAETLLVWSIPNSPRAGSGNPKQYYAKPFAPILAAGKAGKGYVLLTEGDQPGVLRIQRVGSHKGKFDSLPFLLPPDVPAPVLDGSLPPYLLLSEAKNTMHWLVLAGGTLLRPYIDENKPEVQQASPVMGEVMAWGAHSNGWAFVGRGHSGAGQWAVRVFSPDGTMRVTHLLKNVHNAFCGYWNTIAVEENLGTWRICSGRQEEDTYLHPPAHCTVVGAASLIDSQTDDYEEACLLLDANRRQLTLVGKSGLSALMMSPSPIVQVLVCPTRPLMACRLETGEILVYSIQEDVVLLMQLKP